MLKVVTESGLVGFGECEAVSSADLARATQIVTGKPATAYEVIRQQLLPLPGLQAAVNVALLDILGKKAKAPIYQVLGGPTRFKARASAALEGETDEALVDFDEAGSQHRISGLSGAGASGPGTEPGAGLCSGNAQTVGLFAVGGWRRG